ncbi:MAG: hypothetical protein IJO40_11845 [Thermoguttaceae bacterium]|nr:hypothetical protein [Thermoguttaceae bacterium]
MTNREKNDALANVKTTANEGKKETSPTNAPTARTRRAFIAWALSGLGTALLGSEVGCVRGNKRFWRRKKEGETINPLTQTETILQVDGRVERMEIAKNSKRILVESRDFDVSAEDAYLDFFASGGVRTETEGNGSVLELWNVEFWEARREAFDATDPIDVESATFDAAGTRVFWTIRETERNGVFAAVSETEARNNGQNATSAGFQGFATTDGGGSAGIASASATISAESAIDGVRNATYREPNIFQPATRTVLATRAFEGANGTEAFEAREERGTRLKISEAAKRAESVWLSPNARWIVGRVGRDEETSAIGENGSAAQNGEGTAIGEWTLTLRRDRRRVVRFPKAVKMTFAESTSDETIEGRVVDVLAVSPAGDLVATLIEETPSKSGAETKVGENDKNGENSEGGEWGERSAFVPRFKIVIWDLSVPETVDWEKAKKPLQALEVAQIAVAGPVSRRFCRFSPNGQIFAARIDPRYVTLWQSANGRLLVELGEHESDVTDFAFSPNGMKAAATTGTGKRVLLWNIRKGAAHRTLLETASDVSSLDAVAFSPDGGSIFFANDFGEIKRWDARAERRGEAPAQS